MSARGIQRERAVRDVLAKSDWIVFRPGGSLGCADLVALQDGRRPLLVQVKSSAQGPYEHFGPAERLRLAGTARLAGAVPVLAWWPPRGVLRWIPEPEWPNGARKPVRELTDRQTELLSGVLVRHAARMGKT